MNTAILPSEFSINPFILFRKRMRSAGCNARCQNGCGETDRRQRRSNLVISCQSLDFRRQSARDDTNGSTTSSFTGHAVAASHKTRFNALPSAAGGLSRLLTARLRAAGIAPKPLLAKAGLTLAQIDDHN